MFVRNAAGTLVQVVGIAVRDASNTLVNVVGAATRDSEGAMQEWFAMLGSTASGMGAPGAIVLDMDLAEGFVSSKVSVTITTSPCEASLIGASNPTFAWSLVSSDGGVWIITAPNSASTSFRHTLVAANTTYTATFRCLVSDAGQSAYSASVTAIVNNYGSA